MALCRMRSMQIMRRTRPQRPRQRGRDPGALWDPRCVGTQRVAPPDAAGARRAQGVLTLALHSVR